MGYYSPPFNNPFHIFTKQINRLLNIEVYQQLQNVLIESLYTGKIIQDSGTSVKLIGAIAASSNLALKCISGVTNNK